MSDESKFECPKCGNSVPSGDECWGVCSVCFALEGDEIREHNHELRAQVTQLTQDLAVANAQADLYVDAMYQAAKCLEVSGNSMYECILCGATKDQRGHNPGCGVTAALEEMKSSTYSVTNDLAVANAKIEEARALVTWLDDNGGAVVVGNWLGDLSAVLGRDTPNTTQGE